MRKECQFENNGYSIIHVRTRPGPFNTNNGGFNLQLVTLLQQFLTKLEFAFDQEEKGFIKMLSAGTALCHHIVILPKNDIFLCIKK